MNLKDVYLQQDPQRHSLMVRCRFRLNGKPDELHPGQMGILITLAKNGCCNQRTLVRQMNCSTASVNTSIKRLEKSGYVKKETDPEDLRSTRIALTEAGKALAEQSISCMKEIGEIQLDGFSQEEIEQLITFQNRIMANMERFLEETEKKGEL